MDFDKSINATAVHLLKGKWGDILRLPGVRYLDCRTNLALQVRELYHHGRIEIHLYVANRVRRARKQLPKHQLDDRFAGRHTASSAGLSPGVNCHLELCDCPYEYTRIIVKKKLKGIRRILQFTYMGKIREITIAGRQNVLRNSQSYPCMIGGNEPHLLKVPKH